MNLIQSSTHTGPPRIVTRICRNSIANRMAVDESRENIRCPTTPNRDCAGLIWSGALCARRTATASRPVTPELSRSRVNEERSTGRPLFTVVRTRSDNPAVSSENLACIVSAKLGRVQTATAVRQALHRARDRFAEQLLEEVVSSVGISDPDILNDELAEIGLAGYCKAAMARRFR